MLERGQLRTWSVYLFVSYTVRSCKPIKAAAGPLCKPSLSACMHTQRLQLQGWPWTYVHTCSAYIQWWLNLLSAKSPWRSALICQIKDKCATHSFLISFLGSTLNLFLVPEHTNCICAWQDQQTVNQPHNLAEGYPHQSKSLWTIVYMHSPGLTQRPVCACMPPPPEARTLLIEQPEACTQISASYKHTVSERELRTA